MEPTTITLDPIFLLTFLTSASGAGWAGSAILDWLRRELRPTRQDWQRSSAMQRLLWTAVLAPRYARVTVFLLSALIAMVASWPLALFTDQQYWEIVWAAFFAPLLSQVPHTFQLSTVVSLPEET